MTQGDIHGGVAKLYHRLPGGLDRLLAPYSAAAFERVARGYFNGPKLSRFYAILSAALAVIMFSGACLLVATAVKSFYLDSYGVEAPGKILDVSFHTDSDRQHTKWKKLHYEFAVAPGHFIRGRLDRPVRELAMLREGDQFTVLYWDRFPSINSPRGVQSNVGITAVLAGLLLFPCVHFALLSRRLVRWRKNFTADPA
jgi:hypothetical protein